MDIRFFDSLFVRRRVSSEWLCMILLLFWFQLQKENHKYMQQPQTKNHRRMDAGLRICFQVLSLRDQITEHWLRCMCVCVCVRDLFVDFCF